MRNNANKSIIPYITLYACTSNHDNQFHIVNYWIIYMILFYKIFKHISSSVRVAKWSKLIFSLRCQRSWVRFPLDSRSLVKPIHMKSSMVFIRKLVILSRCVRINIQMKYQTRYVFVKHRCPRRQQSHNMAKFSKSYILTPPPGVWDVSEMWGTHRWTYSPSLVTESSPTL